MIKYEDTADSSPVRGENLHTYQVIIH